jgi:hypothetical protein
VQTTCAGALQPDHSIKNQTQTWHAVAWCNQQKLGKLLAGRLDSSGIHSHACSLVHDEPSWWALKSSLHLHVAHMHYCSHYSAGPYQLLANRHCAPVAGVQRRLALCCNCHHSTVASCAIHNQSTQKLSFMQEQLVSLSTTRRPQQGTGAQGCEQPTQYNANGAHITQHTSARQSVGCSVHARK